MTGSGSRRDGPGDGPGGTIGGGRGAGGALERDGPGGTIAAAEGGAGGKNHVGGPGRERLRHGRPRGAPVPGIRGGGGAAVGHRDPPPRRGAAEPGHGDREPRGGRTGGRHRHDGAAGGAAGATRLLDVRVLPGLLRRGHTPGPGEDQGFGDAATGEKLCASPSAQQPRPLRAVLGLCHAGAGAGRQREPRAPRREAGGPRLPLQPPVPQGHRRGHAGVRLRGAGAAGALGVPAVAAEPRRRRLQLPRDRLRLRLLPLRLHPHRGPVADPGGLATVATAGRGGRALGRGAGPHLLAAAPRRQPGHRAGRGGHRHLPARPPRRRLQALLFPAAAERRPGPFGASHHGGGRGAAQPRAAAPRHQRLPARHPPCAVRGGGEGGGGPPSPRSPHPAAPSPWEGGGTAAARSSLINVGMSPAYTPPHPRCCLLLGGSPEIKPGGAPGRGLCRWKPAGHRPWKPSRLFSTTAEKTADPLVLCHSPAGGHTPTPPPPPKSPDPPPAQGGPRRPPRGENRREEFRRQARGHEPPPPAPGSLPERGHSPACSGGQERGQKRSFWYIQPCPPTVGLPPPPPPLAGTERPGCYGRPERLGEEGGQLWPFV